MTLSYKIAELFERELPKDWDFDYDPKNPDTFCEAWMNVPVGVLFEILAIVEGEDFRTAQRISQVHKDYS